MGLSWRGFQSWSLSQETTLRRNCTGTIWWLITCAGGGAEEILVIVHACIAFSSRGSRHGVLRQMGGWSGTTVLRTSEYEAVQRTRRQVRRRRERLSFPSVHGTMIHRQHNVLVKKAQTSITRFCLFRHPVLHCNLS